MSFRDRTDRATDWEADEEIGLTAWPSRAREHRSQDAAPSPRNDVPLWEDEPWDASPSEAPERTRRRSGTNRRAPIEDDAPWGRQDRQWPDLRDSLRGGARREASDHGLGRTADTGARARRRSGTSPDSRWAERSAFDESDDTEFAAGTEAPHPPVPYYRSRRGASTARRRARSQSGQTLRVPAALSAVLLAQDRLVLGVLGGSTLSLLVMALVISLRNNALPAWIAIHINAAGNPDRWGTPATVWRVPLMAAMLTVMNLIAGTFLARWDRFAARFLLGSSILIHVLAWMALIGLLW
ncbi:MAG: hypothetical protein C4346_05915 [Chloroflexota bacterium]